MVRSILVPLDGSALAEQVLPLALSIATRAGARLTLLQVVPVSVEPLTIAGAAITAEQQVALLRRRARTYLRTVARQVRRADGQAPSAVAVKYEIAAGHPASEIRNHAEGAGADLIVMATHGRSGPRRWALGSVAGKVLQLSRTPIILVRPEESVPLRFDRLPALNRILIALDGSELAERVLPVATELGRLFESEIVLFRAANMPVAGHSAPEFQPLLRLRAEADAREYLQRLAPACDARRCEVRTISAAGSAADAILAAVEEIDADLIAMTTHGRTGLGRVVYGSVTDKVVRGSGRPVLVIRSLSQADGSDER